MPCDEEPAECDILCDKQPESCGMPCFKQPAACDTACNQSCDPPTRRSPSPLPVLGAVVFAMSCSGLWLALSPRKCTHDPSSSRSLNETLLKFDELEPVSDLEFMTRGSGRWRGEEVSSGHAMDGFLDVSGWWGKRFTSAEHVDPLLWRGAANSTPFPAAFPLMASHPLFYNLLSFLRARFGSKATPTLIQVTRLLFWTSHSQARLRLQEFRGKVSAVMIYDHFPIIDAFRRVDDDTVMGLMDEKGGNECNGVPQFYFFRLVRDD